MCCNAIPTFWLFLMTLFFLFQSRCTCPETSPRQNKFWLLNHNETVDHGSSLLLPKEEYCPGPDIEVIRRSENWSTKKRIDINIYYRQMYCQKIAPRTKVVLVLCKVAWPDSCLVTVTTQGSAHATLCSTRMTLDFIQIF